VIHPVLAVVSGPATGEEFRVTDRTLVGRDTGSDFVIDDPEVSSRHAYVSPAEGGISIEDLDSTNGTWVNGRRVMFSELVQSGDQLRLGATVLEVRLPTPAAATPAPPQPPAGDEVQLPPAGDLAQPPPAGDEVELPQPVMTRERRIPTMPVLVFVDGERAGEELLVDAHVVVGRDPGAADVILSQDTEVSRRHATFTPAGAGLTVQDLGSTNGTFVNGRRIEGAVALNTGDKVKIGGELIEIRIAGEKVVPPPPGPVTAAAEVVRGYAIEAESLVKAFGKHRAVDGVSLQVDVGQVYGFLGPNGAGKSTMVHMLTTLMPPTRGTARILGSDIVRQSPKVRQIIGVALQAAALDPQLNSWEHMDLQTALTGLPRSQRKPRAQELLERVGLLDAAGRRVGGYSGGMKRRLDLALALVHRPRVLFLDEPTTGLDPQSRTALWEEVARLVKDDGVTVFLTTQYLEEADVLADRVGIIDHGEIVAEDTPVKLKAEIGRPTIEVIPANPEDWARMSGVMERFGELVSAAHTGIAVRLAPGKAGLADVIRALDHEGLSVENVELRAPTLDEVFLAKTGRSLEGAAEDAEELPPSSQPGADALAAVAGPVPLGQ
jgi:ABC-2 type transport system ATP-binding protein